METANEERTWQKVVYHAQVSLNTAKQAIFDNDLGFAKQHLEHILDTLKTVVTGIQRKQNNRKEE